MYRTAGVDTEGAAQALRGLLNHVRETQDFRSGAGASVLPVGFFAGVLRLTDQLLLAVSTDGVGSKSVVAQIVGRYEAIGWDAVAVNVNDVLCTGAEPVAVLDYISCQRPASDLLEQLGIGMRRAAERARVAVVGGEVSQHPDALVGPREGYAFDMAATALGVLRDRAAITGRDVRPGDVVLGLPSSGIHSNGLTLARRILLGTDGSGADRYLERCRRTVGEELLRPTHIYVPEVAAVLSAGVDVRGLAHISGDGLLNLARFHASVAYRITSLLPVPPIFEVIQEEGAVERAEMFQVFNMGVGFCVVVPPGDEVAALEAIQATGTQARSIGHVVSGPAGQVVLEQEGLVGQGGRFVQLALGERGDPRTAAVERDGTIPRRGDGMRA